MLERISRFKQGRDPLFLQYVTNYVSVCRQQEFSDILTLSPEFRVAAFVGQAEESPGAASSLESEYSIKTTKELLAFVRILNKIQNAGKWKPSFNIILDKVMKLVDQCSVSKLCDADITDFPMQVSRIDVENMPDDFLEFHQYVVNRFIRQYESGGSRKTRGMLIYMDTGYGKTILLLSLILFFMAKFPEWKVIGILPTGLFANIEKSALKYLPSLGYSEEFIVEIVAKIKLISIKSNNTHKKLREGSLAGMGSLEKTILFIDEAQNWFNAVTNDSKNAVKIYEEIMNTKDIVLFYTTGTPMINDPHELVPCFNTLRGYVGQEVTESRRGKKIEKLTLLPVSQQQFYKFFVDSSAQSIKNKEKFQNRILGMVSYYGRFYNNKTPKYFPELLSMLRRVVNMSSYQYQRYIMARAKELKEPTWGSTSKPSGSFADKTGTTSTYRYRSRQLSVFACDFADEKLQAGKHLNDDEVREFCENLDKYSPKFVEYLKLVKEKQREVGLFYFRFVKRDMFMFSKVLEYNGFTRFTTARQGADDGQPRFAILSGSVDLDERNLIVNTERRVENKNGDLIKIILLSKAASEGTDLKYVQYICYSPEYDDATYVQVDGRGARFMSHEELPPEQRKVQPYIFLSDYPADLPASKKKEETTDFYLYETSMGKRKLKLSFERALMEASIDCSFHHKRLPDELKSDIKCRMCAPTTQVRYDVSLDRDLKLSDPCVPPESQAVKVKEILVGGRKFYYSIGSNGVDIEIYEYNDKVQGYTEVRIDNKYYQSIINYIRDSEGTVIDFP